jgi:hypothetical protein
MFRFLGFWQKIKNWNCLWTKTNPSLDWIYWLKSVCLIFLKFLGRKKGYEQAVHTETEQQQGPNHYADILQRKDGIMLISR